MDTLLTAKGIVLDECSVGDVYGVGLEHVDLRRDPTGTVVLRAYSSTDVHILVLVDHVVVLRHGRCDSVEWRSDPVVLRRDLVIVSRDLVIVSRDLIIVSRDLVIVGRDPVEWRSGPVVFSVDLVGWGWAAVVVRRNPVGCVVFERVRWESLERRRNAPA
jgi:hypothetical protein